MKELCEQIVQDYMNGTLDKDIADIFTRMIEAELKALHQN
jgi:hypothetical protein